MTDIQPLIEKIRKTVESHYLGNGEYKRFLTQSEKPGRKMGNNEYGCADAANILYSIGAFPRNITKRAERISALQAFQHPDGLFDEGTHHPIHCTAHCIAALELFDAAPKLPLTALLKYKDVNNLYNMLSSLKWSDNPWPTAHEGAGIFAAFILTGNADAAWQDAYFDWLSSRTDKALGIGLQGCAEKGIKPLSHHLNGWFHYLFNFVFAHRAIPCARQAADTCIDLYKNKTGLTPNFGRRIGFAEIDWVYTVHRASSQEGYRVSEVKELLRDFANGYIAYLNGLSFETDDSFNDLHMLFGAVCALAELQLVLPGEIKSDYPTKQVLDRRPFI